MKTKWKGQSFPLSTAILALPNSLSYAYILKVQKYMCVCFVGMLTGKLH